MLLPSTPDDEIDRHKTPSLIAPPPIQSREALRGVAMSVRRRNSSTSSLPGRPVLAALHRGRMAKVTIALLVLAGSAAFTTTHAFAAASSPSAQSSIVLLKAGTDPVAVAKSYGVSTDAVWRTAIDGFSANLTAARVTALRADARVVSVTPNQSTALGQPVGIAAAANATPTQVVPTGVRRIGALKSVTADIDGRDDSRVNADVAVIDTGVDSGHPDLNVAG